MKKMFNLKTAAVVIALIVVAIAIVYINNSSTVVQQNSYEIVDASDMVVTDELLVDSAIINVENMLTADEIAGLLQMREEEKLAKDVYLELYDIWELPILYNIAQSEATHTNSVEDLLIKYNIDDPVTDDSRGAFTNSVFTDLYNQLIGQGSVSAVDALKVGATIEDLDIKDLDDLLLNTQNEDIRIVYSNLVKGSRNHIRSFAQNLEKYNAEYEPVYISVEDYQQIISNNRETGTIR